MSFKYLALLFVLLLSFGMAFAGNFGPIDINNMYIGVDRNYYQYPFDLNAVSDGSPDVNSDSLCWYISDEELNITAATWHTDTNTCSALSIDLAYEDDEGYYMIVSSGQGDVNYNTDTITVWLDNAAPSVTVTPTTYGTYTNIDFVSLGEATSTGVGVDFNQLQYMIDGNGDWITVTDANFDINVMLDDFPIGDYFITYWATDDFDNNTGIVLEPFSMTGSAPVITGPTRLISGFYEGSDRNYFTVPSRIQSGVVTDVDLDFNILSCQYTLYDTNGDIAFTMLAADWNADVNRCQIDLAVASYPDDYNFNFRVTDDEGNDTNGLPAYVWKDSNAPTSSDTVTSNYNYSTVAITGTDVATNTGSGSGSATIYYSIDGGTWTSTADPASVEVRGGGEHTVYYYALDNLDNNEGGPNSTTFTVSGMTNNTCSLIPVVLLALAAVILISILGLAFTGNLNTMTLSALVITLISVLIIMYMSGVFVGQICA